MSQSLLVEDVFVTAGPPEFTFVKPPNYNPILVDVRKSGKPVIVEGQSGTGKTTCIRQVLLDLADQVKTEYLSAREVDHVSRIEAIASDRPAGRFVIDDFHRLSTVLQERLADIAKLAAESPVASSSTKLIIVGINQVGSGLIQLVPDIAKRIGIHRIKPGRQKEIFQIISIGSSKLNVEIVDRKTIFEESRGDYWLTQQLCQSICLSKGVLKTMLKRKRITFDILAIRGDVVEQLQSAHYPAVKEFCRGRRFRPSNQPYYKVLRAIGQSGSSNVDLNELANSEPDLRGSINNIKEHRLPILIESKPLVARSFYYNKDTKSFSIDDPALFFFIQHLNWDQLRKDCGFRDIGESYEYDIALSFAGENRELARYITQQLEKNEVSVFFDEMFEANFLGGAWNKIFKEIFSEKSRYVVCLLDAHHLMKIWPTFEREHFAPRVQEGSVFPIYLDDSKFVGIPADTVAIKYNFYSTESDWRADVDKLIIDRLLRKLA